MNLYKSFRKRRDHSVPINNIGTAYTEHYITIYVTYKQTVEFLSPVVFYDLYCNCCERYPQHSLLILPILLFVIATQYFTKIFAGKNIFETLVYMSHCHVILSPIYSYISPPYFSQNTSSLWRRNKVVSWC